MIAQERLRRLILAYRIRISAVKRERTVQRWVFYMVHMAKNEQEKKRILLPKTQVRMGQGRCKVRGERYHKAAHRGTLGWMYIRQQENPVGNKDIGGM